MRSISASRVIRPGQRVRLVQHLQAAVLGLQRRQAISPIDGQAEQLRVERLGEEVIGAERDRAKGIGLIVLARENDHLDVRIDPEQLLEQPESFRHRIRIGRQAEVHRHHGGAVSSALHERAFPVRRSHGLESVERPFDLLLQRQVVFDDEQGWRLVGVHLALDICRAEASCDSKSGSAIDITVPRPGALSTEMLPPSSRTYW